jgi:hypothetical protein
MSGEVERRHAYADRGVPCQFPGCHRTAPLAGGGIDDHDAALCFDHGEMLFYDEDEFDRLWLRLTPCGGVRPSPPT